jgi:AbrB family transcriptional regulator (stage V sporulation protein T)
MKATGIVRRIDELGRVVIPKEIRRTQRIRQGDPLEIFTTGEGEVIFKKYSPIGELSDFAEQYASVLSKSLSMTAFVCDRDNIIAAGGTGRREVLDKRVSIPLEKLMDARKTFVHTGRPAECIFPCESCTRHILAVTPILAAGDVIGAVGLLSEEKSGTPADEEIKSVEIAAAFLAKQMEE